MEQKKIVIMAAAVLIILAGAFSYLASDKDTRKDDASIAEDDSEGGEDSSISDSYSEEKDTEGFKEATGGDFAVLEKLVDAYPNTDFTAQQEVSFDWMTGSGDLPKKLEGKSIEAVGLVGRVDFGNFFEKTGFEEDLDNAADGTTNGQQGFSDGEIACLYEYTSQGVSEDEADGGSLLYDIKVSCAEVSEE